MYPSTEKRDARTTTLTCSGGSSIGASLTVALDESRHRPRLDEKDEEQPPIATTATASRNAVNTSGRASERGGDGRPSVRAIRAK